MDIENTGAVSESSSTEQASTGELATSAAPPVADKETSAPNTPADPAHEPSLKERFAQKAAEAAERRQKEAEKAQKAPKTTTPEVKTAPKTTNTSAAGPAQNDPKTPPPGAAEPPKFAPNYKFKVMDKELEVPESLKGAIKDEATQKEVIELLEKAHGLDVVKPKLQETRAQLQQVSQSHQGVLSQINEVKDLYNRGDLDGFFRRLNIPQETVLQWVADKVTYNQLPPEQKAILDARRQAEERAWNAEKQASTHQSQHEQILTQQVQMALDSVLARSDVKAIADAYDARVNQPGAFKAEVNRRGDYAWRTRNELVPPEKLVQELMTIVGPIAPTAPAPAAPQAQTQSPAQAAAPAAPAGKVPVIPNISGSSASAVGKSQLRSLDDLKNIRKQRQAAQLRQ